MRKISLGLFMSLDGVVQGPGPSDEYEYAGWTMPYWSDDVGAVIGGNMATADTLLLGRVTYDGFKSSFENGTDPMASYLNGVRKYVASTTLPSADWNNTTQLRSNVVDEVAKLKQQPGQDIGMSGSITLAKSLMARDLIDEFSLLIYPVVLGTGTRLFPDGYKKDLTLVETKALPHGVIHALYRLVK